MTEIYLDCTGIQQPKQLHEALCKALSFPDWYGHNLDALYDVLTETNAHLVVQKWDTLGVWCEGFALTFADAARENPSFTFTLE